MANISSTMARISRSEQTAAVSGIVADGLIDHLAVAGQRWPGTAISSIWALVPLSMRQLGRHLAHVDGLQPAAWLASTGTSTQQPSGRLSIRPKLRTLPLNLNISPSPKMALKMYAAYSLAAAEIDAAP